MPVYVKGYTQFVRACNRAVPETKSAVRAELLQAGELVRADAKQRFEPFDPRSAAGLKTKVRVRGVSVEQTIARTTGTRPQFGALQMRVALLPAAAAKEHAVYQGMDRAMSRLCARF